MGFPAFIFSMGRAEFRSFSVGLGFGGLSALGFAAIEETFRDACKGLFTGRVFNVLRVHVRGKNPTISDDFRLTCKWARNKAGFHSRDL